MIAMKSGIHFTMNTGNLNTLLNNVTSRHIAHTLYIYFLTNIGYICCTLVIGPVYVRTQTTSHYTTDHILGLNSTRIVAF